MKTPFAKRDDDWYRARLAEPTGKLRLVIDTDAANEIDDQFALCWALQSPERLEVLAVYAAPFSFAHRRSAAASVVGGPDSEPGVRFVPRPDAPVFDPPGVGMERSYQEILTVCAKLGRSPDGQVFRGSAGYLPGAGVPLDSDAVRHLIATARATPPHAPLYVVALGCVTNIASALLLAPDIADKIVVVWTSGYPSHAPHVNDSFNLEQDVPASALLMDSGVPLVYLPGFHVGAQLRLSLAEVEQRVSGRGAIGDYLHHLYTHNPLRDLVGPPDPHAPSWVIWDLICLAWLIDPRWVPSTLVRAPALGPDRRWQMRGDRHLMREGHAVARDAIFGDLFRKLEAAVA